MTIAIALLVIPFIPDYPGFTKRWWLPREHQLLAVSILSYFACTSTLIPYACTNPSGHNLGLAPT